MREALEAAIDRDPDDPRVYGVYADWLTEQGDVRGELIALQLQLEDDALAPEVRARLQAREAELLAEHGPTWLGPLYAILEEAKRPYRDWVMPGSFQLRRGFLYAISVPDLSDALLDALAASPEQVRTLRSLSIFEAQSPWHGHKSLEALPLLPRLERFSFTGRHAGGQGIATALTRMPALRELEFHGLRADGEDIFPARLPELRVLRMHAQHDLPLDLLVCNSTMARLEVLEIEPHAVEPGDEAYLDIDSVRTLAGATQLGRLRELSLRQCSAGDEGIAALLEAPFFVQLRHLDLSYGVVTDDGALLLTDALLNRPSRLRSLSLRYNRLTALGCGALEEVGLDALHLDEQYDLRLFPRDARQYLVHGSWE